MFYTKCFLGYPTNYEWYKRLDLSKNKVYICRHDLFNEAIFPFSNINSFYTPSIANDFLTHLIYPFCNLFLPRPSRGLTILLRSSPPMFNLSKNWCKICVDFLTHKNDIDCRGTFNLVVKLVTFPTILNLLLSKSWYLLYLGMKNAFLHGNLTKTSTCINIRVFITPDILIMFVC